MCIRLTQLHIGWACIASWPAWVAWPRTSQVSKNKALHCWKWQSLVSSKGWQSQFSLSLGTCSVWQHVWERKYTSRASLSTTSLLSSNCGWLQSFAKPSAFLLQDVDAEYSYNQEANTLVKRPFCQEERHDHRRTRFHFVHTLGLQSILHCKQLCSSNGCFASMMVWSVWSRVLPIHHGLWK